MTTRVILMHEEVKRELEVGMQDEHDVLQVWRTGRKISLPLILLQAESLASYREKESGVLVSICLSYHIEYDEDVHPQDVREDVRDHRSFNHLVHPHVASSLSVSHRRASIATIWGCIPPSWRVWREAEWLSRTR